MFNLIRQWRNEWRAYNSAVAQARVNAELARFARVIEHEREPECPFCGAKGVSAYDCTICFGEYAK